MTHYQLINPESLGAPKGWTNGMLAPAGGRILFVAGQTAQGPDGKIGDLGFVTQFRHALSNVLAVVEEAGGRPSDVGRFTIFVTEVETYLDNLKEVGVIYRELMGKHFPAMALVEVSRLVDERARVEIEATAVLVGT